MQHPVHLLLIDDNPHDRELLTREIRQHFSELHVEPARDEAEFDRALTRGEFDAVVIDHQLRWATGLALLRRIKSARPTCPVIMFTASGNEEVAVEAMKEGLDDYIIKSPRHYARLPFALEACLERVHQSRRADEAQAHLAAIVESSLDAILSETPQGIITSWNSGAARLFGFSASEMIGQPVTRIVPPELHEHERVILERLRQGEQIAHYDTERISKDGRRISVSITISPIRDHTGTLIGASKVARDITDRVVADRRKDTFLATLAHELRNPLAPIRYATRLLEPGVPPQMAEDARRMIDRQLAQMARLLDDLLDVSRITRGVLEIRRDTIDLRDALETAVEAARPLARAANLDLHVQSASGPLPVLGDTARLTQAIGNVISNAIKYTNPGGHVEIDALADGGEMVVRVRDDGIGIPQDQLPKIFDLFVQLEPSGQRAAGGLGIGLSLTRELVEMHDGRIEAHSGGLGQGSVFEIRLPRAAEKTAVTEPVAAPEKVVALGASDVRVLIADDNVDAVDALSKVLALAGYRVHVAYDGTSALELAERLRPTVLLLDVGLPDLSGHELARRIRDRPWGGSAQLIAITGWGREDDRNRSRAAGFDEHLTKPVEPEVLLQLIARVARGAA